MAPAYGPAGTAGFAFYDGLWVPLLRDGQSAEEAAAGTEGLLDEAQTLEAAQRLLRGEVAVLDGVLSSDALKEIREELRLLASAGGLQPNPKVQAGNVEIRTDQVCYLRDPSSFTPVEMEGVFRPPLGGPRLRRCHRALRATGAQLEKGFARAATPRKLIVTDWSQLAQYVDGSGFYKWHTDGLDAKSLGFGPRAWYLWLQLGALRRRSVTGILYLNEEDWPSSGGGALRCKAPAAGLPSDRDGAVEVLPKGGRLVLFNSQQVEHEAKTNGGRHTAGALGLDGAGLWQITGCTGVVLLQVGICSCQGRPMLISMNVTEELNFNADAVLDGRDQGYLNTASASLQFSAVTIPWKPKVMILRQLIAALLVILPVDARGLFSKYTKVLPFKECTCNCCIREPRRFSELPPDGKGSNFKCALAPSSDPNYSALQCNDQCTVVNDPIFFRSSTLSTDRFCFYHCVPTSGGSASAVVAAAKNQDQRALENGGSLLDAACVSVPEDKLAQAISPDGNGQDAYLVA
ncbi:unnamed protein product [Effrenium voratum]|uniref:Prolyl 4-hydroxylase alpha subunit Fe(2+) 2OG dioxygenase domain-containing protein n=1 Tax=Effrenium voratum TaxID=2562239 RepID=A0AA36IX31_9DINO|nr:unnamed protein product [Effrenium voratum]